MNTVITFRFLSAGLKRLIDQNVDSPQYILSIMKNTPTQEYVNQFLSELEQKHGEIKYYIPPYDALLATLTAKYFKNAKAIVYHKDSIQFV